MLGKNPLEGGDGGEKGKIPPQSGEFARREVGSTVSWESTGKLEE